MTKNSDWNDLDDEDDNPVFWTVFSSLPDYLVLSMSCNWRFTNLNVAFRAVVGEPTRSLHVYSDVAGSTIVGNRVTDLLREIQYKRQGRGTLYFEPLHIQYMSLRNEVVEIIHIQVTETIGTGGDFATRWWKSFTFKWPKRLALGETWSSLATAIPLSRCTSKRHKKGVLERDCPSQQDAQDKSASKETKETSTRRFIASRRSHSSLDRWGESRGVGSSGRCG